MVQWLRVCLPVQGTRVRALVWEDPTCRRAAGPLSHSYWACVSGACAPQQERPRQWEARAPRWRVAPACRNHTETKTQHTQKLKKKKKNPSFWWLSKLKILLLSCDHCNKSPQVEWLKTAQVYFLSEVGKMGLKELKSRCGQGCLPRGLQGGGTCFLASPASRGAASLVVALSSFLRASTGWSSHDAVPLGLTSAASFPFKCSCDQTGPTQIRSVT